MWLSTHGFADVTVSPIDGVAPLIDVLWLALQHIDAREVAALFDRAVPADMQMEVVTNVWRLDVSELADVLEALGKAHPRKEIAKAARKSLMQHRSLMASLHHVK